MNPNKPALALATHVAISLLCLSIPARQAIAATGVTKVLVEVNDYTAAKNPIKSFNGTKLSLRDTVAKIGRLKATSAISIVCEGDFKAGYIADDLIQSGNRWNRDYMQYRDGTLMEVCLEQEKDYLSKHPRR